ncbi:MAG: hypothetical protein JST68_19680 [Bacteroidetes bacterium]|nr:hypothetical protein [Bacteroidota bacterium]
MTSPAAEGCTNQGPFPFGPILSKMTGCETRNWSFFVKNRQDGTGQQEKSLVFFTGFWVENQAKLSLGFMKKNRHNPPPASILHFNSQL